MYIVHIIQLFLEMETMCSLIAKAKQEIYYLYVPLPPEIIRHTLKIVFYCSTLRVWLAKA